MIIVQKFGGSSVASIDHIKKVATFIKESKGKNSIVVVVSAMSKTTNNLLNEVKQISSTPNLREVDQLLSTGEIVSASLLAICLNEIGVKTVSLTGRQAGILTNHNHGRAFIKNINTKRIKKELEKNNVVIVTGFQGVTQCGDTTTLGRGGSDTSAVALACALNASCEIYSDIDCLYACDPRFCANPKPIQLLDYDTTIEMAFNGAKALETRAVEIAKKYNKKIYTGKSLNMDKTKGTLIKKQKNNFENVKIINLCVKNQILHIKIKLFNKKDSEKILFNIFSKYSIPLEMLKKVYANKNCYYYFCLDETLFNNIKKEISLCGKVQVDFKSKISLIGNGVATHSEIASDLINILNDNNIQFHDISVSEFVISLLVDNENLQKTVDLLVNKFDLGVVNEKI